jgi:hypothetical protein
MNKRNLVYILSGIICLCTSLLCISKGVTTGYIWGGANLLCVLYCWNQVLDNKYLEGKGE